MSTLYEWDHRHSSQVPRLWLELIRAHDQIFSEANKALLKRLAIAVSIVGFAVHLVRVFLSPGGSSPGAASNLPRPCNTFQDRSSVADTGAESYLQSPLSRTSWPVFSL